MKEDKKPEYPLVSSEIEKYMVDTLTTTTALSAHEKKYGDTHCEIVNENEIYLLSRNPHYEPANPKSTPFIRGRRICGALRNAPWKDGTNQGDRLRCLLPAGKSTNHVGYGMCFGHGMKAVSNGPTKNLRVLKGMKKKGFALELSELDQVVGGVLNDPELGEVDYEIAVFQHLLAVELQKETHSVNPKTVVSIGDSLVKAKLAKAKIEQERLLMDVNSVRLFIRGIFEVLRANLPQALYSKIAHLIEDAVVFPINKPMQDILAKQANNIDEELDPDKEITSD